MVAVCASKNISVINNKEANGSMEIEGGNTNGNNNQRYDNR